MTPRTPGMSTMMAVELLKPPAQAMSTVWLSAESSTTFCRSACANTTGLAQGDQIAVGGAQMSKIASLDSGCSISVLLNQQCHIHRGKINQRPVSKSNISPRRFALHGKNPH